MSIYTRFTPFLHQIHTAICYTLSRTAPHLFKHNEEGGILGIYDKTMKMLVDADPTAFANFILGQAQRTGDSDLTCTAIRSVERLNTEFQSSKTEADGLLLIECHNDFRYLMQIEIQTKKHLIIYCRSPRQ